MPEEDRIGRKLGELFEQGKIYGEEPVGLEKPQAGIEFTKLVDAIDKLPKIPLSLVKKGDIIKVYGEDNRRGYLIPVQGDFIVVSPARRLISHPHPTAYTPAELAYLKGNIIHPELQRENILPLGSSSPGSNSQTSSSIVEGLELVYILKNDRERGWQRTPRITSFKLFRREGLVGHYQQTLIDQLEEKQLSEGSEDYQRLRNLFKGVNNALPSLKNDYPGSWEGFSKGNYISVLKSNFESEASQILVYNRDRDCVYEVYRYPGDLNGEDIFHVGVFNQIDRKYANSLSSNPYEFAQSVHAYNFSNGNLDGSAANMLQGQDKKYLKRKKIDQPTIVVDKEHVITVEDRGAEGVKAEIKGENLVTEVDGHTFNMPLHFDTRDLIMTVDKIITTQPFYNKPMNRVRNLFRRKE